MKGKQKMYQYQKTFGPIVIEGDDERGSLVANCVTRGGETVFGCMFHIGGHCTDQKRDLPEGTNVTPDWCKFLKGALADAAELDDFRRMGLDKMTRDELLRAARNLSPDYKPSPLTKATAYQLRRAIRSARLAEGAAA